MAAPVINGVPEEALPGRRVAVAAPGLAKPVGGRRKRTRKEAAITACAAARVSALGQGPFRRPVVAKPRSPTRPSQEPKLPIDA